MRRFVLSLILLSIFLIAIGTLLLKSGAERHWLKLPFLSENTLGPHLFSQIGVLAQEALFRGILLLVLTLIVTWQMKRIRGWNMKPTRMVVIAAIVFAAICLPVVISGHSAIIAGERYWWLADDPMISMRYAYHLANGHGLVWNPGERVEGYTTFLWTLWMAVPHVLHIPLSKTSILILITSVGLAIFTLFPLRKWMQTLKVDDTAFVFVFAAFVFSKNILAWAVSGFETSLLMFLIVWIIYRVMHDVHHRSPTLFSHLLIGLIPLVRSDGLVLAGLLYLFSFSMHKDKKKVLMYSAISFLLPTGHLLFRLAYYGQWLPNTAYLKTFGWPGKYGAGIGYLLGFIWHYWLLIGFALFAALRGSEKSLRWLLCGCGLYALYVVFTGGDAFGNFRFFIPILPLLFVIGVHGIRTVTASVEKRWLLAILCFVSLPLSPLSYKNIVVPFKFDVDNIRIGLLIKKNTPPDCKVADCWGGSVFYFSERFGVDLLGKMDPEVARRPAFPGANMAGHNKFDYTYSLDIHKPDIVIANFKLPLTEAEILQRAKGDWAFVGQLYFNPVFQQHYLPNSVSLETPRSIFIRNDSPLLANRNQWQNLNE